MGTQIRIERLASRHPDSLPGIGGNRLRLRRSTLDEVDRDRARIALAVCDRHRVAIARLQLTEQGQRVMVVDKAHRLAGIESVQRAEDGSVTKSLGNPP